MELITYISRAVTHLISGTVLPIHPVPTQSLIVVSRCANRGMDYVETATGVRFVDTSDVVHGVAGDFYVIRITVSEDAGSKEESVPENVTDAWAQVVLPIINRICTDHMTYRQIQNQRRVFLTGQEGETPFARTMRRYGYYIL